jgi:general stress protein 26
MTTKQEQFDSLVESVGVAMMTTRTSEGHLRSRAMANQKKASGADLWFVTSEGSSKLDDLSQDPHIGLSYYKDGSREWISVSGIVTISKDREKIKELYASDWKMWFNEGNGPASGTVDDPKIVLIGVKVHVATFFAVDHPAPVVLYELAKGWLTGTAPDLGEVKTL